ncbi:hypothetical protein WISP_01443 [Willisornis vidua]|uniref:Uncharacterized protein n=1 Tax=Willisornis vidua TaxID=1566151 RepID=A0ABQ9DUG9_9PASS|nr:hypothetical protein WISP_01443 [Willisornis vidua]
MELSMCKVLSSRTFQFFGIHRNHPPGEGPAMTSLILADPPAWTSRNLSQSILKFLCHSRRGAWNAQQVPVQNSLDIPPQNSLDNPPQISLDIPPQNSLDIPPQSSLDIPPQSSLDIKPQIYLNIPPQNSLDILP